MVKGQLSRKYIAEFYRLAGFALCAPFGTHYIQTLVLNEGSIRFFSFQLLMTIPPLLYGLLFFATGYGELLKLDKEKENNG